jgi:HicB_like antitoxin of bacterial toxin-antitoxin system
MFEDGEKIPKPSKIDDLVDDPDRQNAVAFLVSADFDKLQKSKTLRVNVTARANQIELIDGLARQAGMTRSAYMVRSATLASVFQDRPEPARRRIRVPSKRAAPSRTRKK